jgi:uracil-DNA glycosylase
MMTKCAHHLVNELKLLKPSLVVFHGVDARDHIRPEFAARDMDLKAVSTVEDRWGPVLYEAHGLGARVLFLYHPSRGYLNRQWKSVVVPALNYLRHLNLIPS